MRMTMNLITRTTSFHKEVNPVETFSGTLALKNNTTQNLVRRWGEM